MSLCAAPASTRSQKLCRTAGNRKLNEWASQPSSSVLSAEQKSQFHQRSISDDASAADRLFVLESSHYCNDHGCSRRLACLSLARERPNGRRDEAVAPLVVVVAARVVVVVVVGESPMMTWKNSKSSARRSDLDGATDGSSAHWMAPVEAANKWPQSTLHTSEQQQRSVYWRVCRRQTSRERNFSEPLISTSCSTLVILN